LFQSIVMAETALAVIGLLGLFSTAVACFEYVRLAKTFERDFATSQLKLDDARIRLSVRYLWYTLDDRA
jgi:hypothetical protein